MFFCSRTCFSRARIEAAQTTICDFVAFGRFWSRSDIADAYAPPCRQARKQRAKVIKDIDELKTGCSKKTEEEQLKRLEDDMAQYVDTRPHSIIRAHNT